MERMGVKSVQLWALWSF